ncbi:unnamed protein product, partial [Clonostachys rhizophaga]
NYKIAIFVLFTLCFYLFISAVAADPLVSIAAAYDAEINNGWARYVYWLRPDDNSPLAALYRYKDTGLFVSYLDKEGNMIDVVCRHEGDKYSTYQLKYKASSGLALAEADYKL